MTEPRYFVAVQHVDVSGINFEPDAVDLRGDEPQMNL